MNSKQLDIYITVSDENIFLGTLFVNVLRGKEIYSFEYSDIYLKSTKNLIFDKELQLTEGRQYKSDSSTLYGFLQDVIPDRWGRNLLKRKEKLLSEKENRPQITLGESDYLVGISDESRMGAIRITHHGKTDFLNNDVNDKIPSVEFIGKLEYLAYNLSSLEDKELRDLFAPGSSLGGARPKATVYDASGEMYLAKFSNKFDDYNVPGFEMLNNELAKLVGLNVPEHKLISSKIDDFKSIFLAKRFDRDKDKRLLYVSAMTLLGAKDGENDEYSYLDLLDLIEKYSIQPKIDTLELYKRLMFNYLIHNGDDHLRNHGFINEGKGYKLSPVFDINTVFDSDSFSLTIDGNERRYSLEAILDISKYFSLSKEEAVDIYKEMKDIILKNVTHLASKYSLNGKYLNDFINIVKNS